MRYPDSCRIVYVVLRVPCEWRVRHPCSRIKTAARTTERNREEISRLLLNLNAERIRTFQNPVKSGAVFFADSVA